MTTLNITSMNGDHLKFAYDLDVLKENTKSIYAIGMYGDEYRIEKKTGRVFKNGIQIAEKCEYEGV